MKGQRSFKQMICRSLPLQDRLRTDLQKTILSNSKRNDRSKLKTMFVLPLLASQNNLSGPAHVPWSSSRPGTPAVFPEIRYPCVLAVEAGTLLRWEWHGMAPINSDRWGAGANGPTRSHFGRSSRRNREAAWLVTASTHFIRSPKYETEVAIFDGLVGGKT